MVACVHAYSLTAAPARGPVVVRVDPPGAVAPVADRGLTRRRLSAIELATMRLDHVLFAVSWLDGAEVVSFGDDVESWRRCALMSISEGKA
jgi:hypothetical protein